MTVRENFLPAVDDLLVVRLYGKKIEDLTINPAKQAKSPLIDAYSGSALAFAWIYGAQVLGACRKVPTPFLAVVPDTAVDPVGCDEFGDPKEYRMWVLPSGAPLVKLSHQLVTAEQVLAPDVRPFLDVNADFHLHDVQLNGTVISAKLRSYLHLHQSGPFGTTLFDITVVDRDDTLSFDFNQLPCVTVFTIAVASAQICFHANPNRICGEVVVGIDLPVVGHWGQTFTIACVNV
jgi:hypothetical protein